MSAINDRSLRFYSEILDLKHLHYGLWNMDDEICFEKLKIAQNRYEDYLIANLPLDIKKVLDVGCGTGSLSTRLQQEGFLVEGLSPDIHQKKIFENGLHLPFNHCRFEDFIHRHDYDCLIMSESAQYIPCAKLFDKACEVLSPNGYLMICDYFVKNDASGILARSGHNLDNFLFQASCHHFSVIRQEDITDRIIQTLDLAKNAAEKLLLCLNLLTEKHRAKYPRIYKILCRVFKNKILKIQSQFDLVDSKKFKQNKSYLFFLFQLKTASS